MNVAVGSAGRTSGAAWLRIREGLLSSCPVWLLGLLMPHSYGCCIPVILFTEGPRVALLQTNATGHQIKERRCGRSRSTRGRPFIEGRRNDTGSGDLAGNNFAAPGSTTAAFCAGRRNAICTDYMAREDLSELARRWPVKTLYGVPSFQWDRNGQRWRFNSALLVDARGNPMARYDKIHLVPLGEYVPFPETFPFLQAFTPYDTEYSCKPGETWTRFPVQVGERSYYFDCLICYEDTVPRSLGNTSGPSAGRHLRKHLERRLVPRLKSMNSIYTVDSVAIETTERGASSYGHFWHQLILTGASPPGDLVEVEHSPTVLRGICSIDNWTMLHARFGDWPPVFAVCPRGDNHRGFPGRHRTALQRLRGRSCGQVFQLSATIIANRVESCRTGWKILSYSTP